MSLHVIRALKAYFMSLRIIRSEIFILLFLSILFLSINSLV